MSKKLEFDAFLASSKDAFTVEMKDTFAGFRSEFSTWKNSITPAAISLQATVARTKFMEELRKNVTALSDEILGNITALLETVKSLDEKITRAHGHVTKTALPSLSLWLDILEQHTTRVPLDVVGEPPPSLPPEPKNVARAPPPSLPPEPNAAPPPAALSVVLPSEGQLCHLDTATGPCIPARRVLAVST